MIYPILINLEEHESTKDAICLFCKELQKKQRFAQFSGFSGFFPAFSPVLSNLKTF
jgi:hypothetical protein